ncbi:MAG: DUF4012 domain-containing protein [Candidatus Gracilibacteria bacterium]|jgi:hypothetical protein
MKNKILRDIQSKGSFLITIKDHDLHVPQEQKNVLDLSASNKGKSVITQTCESKSKKSFSYKVDNGKNQIYDKVSELTRLVACGILILFALNGINIYQRGLVIKDNIIASAAAGYQQIQNAGVDAKNVNFNAANDNFDKASTNFQAALKNINFLSSNQNLFFSQEKTVQTVEGILQAGKNVSEAGKDFAKGIENIKQLPELILKENQTTTSVAQDSAQPKILLTTKLRQDLSFLDKASQELEIANDNLVLVDPKVLPPQYEAKFQDGKNKVAALLQIVQSFQERIPVFLKLLGDRYPHRYLILLQNDTESRPTGGFIGSYIIADFNDGYLTKMDFHDVYESDGQLQEDIPAPEDIARISKNWRLRDSNYSPDFAISAEKAAWFLQKEKGPSVDSVIAINQHFLADLFDITGPITLDGLNAALTKDNYQTILSYMIESKLSGAQDPKKILREFIPAFKDKLFKNETFGKTLAAFVKGLKEKSILLYSRDSEIQKLFDDLYLSGRVTQIQPTDDYLNVITTSIGGNKSDLYIKQNLQHDTFVDLDGNIVDNLTISRTDTWNLEALQKIKKTIKSFGFDNDLSPTLKFILGGGKNKSFIKVYVPKDSVLLSADGIDQSKIETKFDEEIQKTYFMFEMNVNAEYPKTFSLSYKLPNRLKLATADAYRIFIQKQPGIVISSLKKRVIFKPGISIYKKYPENLPKDESGQLQFTGDLNQDLYFAALIGK